MSPTVRPEDDSRLSLRLHLSLVTRQEEEEDNMCNQRLRPTVRRAETCDHWSHLPLPSSSPSSSSSSSPSPSSRRRRQRLTSPVICLMAVHSLLLLLSLLIVPAFAAESLGSGCIRTEERDRSLVSCRIKSLHSLPVVAIVSKAKPVALSISCHDNKTPSSLSLANLNASSLSSASTHVNSNNKKLENKLDDVRDLRIERCKISEVPANVFNSVPSLVNLTIRSLVSSDTGSWTGARGEFVDDDTIPGMLMSPGSLSKQTELQSLDLGFNGMSSLPGGLFCLLTHLRVLNVTNNRLTSFESLGLVDPTTGYLCLQELKVLDFSHNKIRFLSETSIVSLKNLQALYLHHNQMNQVADLSLSSLSKLAVIDLSSNKLTSIPSRLFRDSVDLTQLFLHKNNIQHLAHGVFDDAPSLREIHVQENQLADINGLFMNLPNLRLLNVSRNRISWFDYALIPGGLNHLDIRGNQIEFLSNYYSAVLSLRLLDASHNKIQEIDPLSFPDGVTHVDLSHNSLRRIAPFAFMGKSNLTRVDLRFNRLTTVDMNSFQLSKTRSLDMRGTRVLPDFLLSENPYSCDCNMEWMKGMLTLDESGQYPRFQDADHINCQLTFRKKDVQQSLPLNRVNSTSFLCQYKSHCFALCHCCDFDACDCEMSCPDNCNCYYDQGWNNNIVDCSASPSFIHRMVPPRIPMDVTELYLDNNEIHTLTSHTFIGRRNLKTLHMNNSGIYNISNHTFNGLKALQLLNLRHNHLTSLKGFEFEPLVELKELFLSYNQISVIHNKTFSSLKNLRVLHLDHNYVYQFTVWQLNSNTRLHDIRLAHNSWSCDCLFLKQLTPWLQDKLTLVSDATSMLCGSNESAVRRILASDVDCTNFVQSYAPSVTPPSHSAPNSASSPASSLVISEIVPLVAIVTCSSLLLIVVLIFLFVYRKEVSVWFYSRFGVRIQGRATASREDEKLFDCFISYSKMDEAFVTQILAPELEYCNPPFRLCLHYRDLPVASGYLSSDAIVEAMEASRRSILVISENFLKGEWCRYGFKSAHLEVLRSNQRHKLILIFIGTINPQDFDPDIRFWLKRSTILQWGEKMFWEKLRYAMPDVAARKTYPDHTTRGMTVAVHI